MPKSHWFCFGASLLLLAACAANEDVAPGQMVLTEGHEDDVWTRKPRPVTAIVERIEGSEASKVATLSVPLERFDLDFGSAARFRITGLDADESVVVVGQSVYLAPASFGDTEVPLFVSRAREFARPPGELDLPQGSAPLVGSVWGQFMLSFGALDDDGHIAIDGYDTFLWGPAAPTFPITCPKPPCQAESMLMVGDGFGLVAGTGFATVFDLYEGTAAAAKLPSGLETFDSIAGGETAYTPAGTAFVVGGTRMAAPSDAVLEVSRDFELGALELHHPRQGAASTWHEKHGLVVVGGNAEDPGVELLAADADAFATVAYPPDPTVGAAIVPFGTNSVLRIGGELDGAPAPTLEIQLDCEADCEPSEFSMPIALTRPRAFEIGKETVLVIGEDAEGWTTGYRIGSDAEVTEVPLRDARRGGTAVLSPTGHIAVIGGVDGAGESVRTLELYME